MTSYKLHAPEASFRAFSALIAAEYNGVSVEVSSDLAAAALSPTGKLPILEIQPKIGASSRIFSSHAIARFIAGLRRDTGLTGDNFVEQAAVDSWMDFCAQDLELPSCIWFYPVAGYMPFTAEAYEKSKTDLAAGLTILNNHLMDKTYLVNDQITLADIVIASTLLYPFKLVCDKAYLKPFQNVTRWFQTCVNQKEFEQVVGKVPMCKKEATAPGQSGSAGKKGGKKGGAKKEKAAAPAPPPAPKKVEHPYKIMDKEAPSKFSMDAWKKTYSNSRDYNETMNQFWDLFDKEGWSLWLQTYNYNEENKRAFMTSNAIGGYQQRTDEIRKWAFGVMDVLGTEETSLEIAGVWLLRGDSVDCMVQANDDANWYTWKKLAGKGLDATDECKSTVTAYWTEEDVLEGKPIQDSKVFK